MSKLRQKFSRESRRDGIFSPPPFCQDAPPLSGGLLSRPRPGLAAASRAGEARRIRFYPRDGAAVAGADALRAIA